ncbi:MAG: DUF5309 domain-containing protein [Candidatus Brocadiaceae bacterium]|nr:DUF5309 domain-containing protein [Candidatus Brocadiaceae bacterium]
MSFETYARDIVSRVESVSKVFHEPDEEAHGIIAEINAAEKIGTTRHEWYEKSQRVRATAVATAYTAEDATVLVDDVTYFSIGNIISFASGDDVYRVTAIAEATNALTINLELGTAADHAVDQVVTIVSRAVPEGSTPSQVARNPEIKVHNFTQIQLVSVKASKTRIAQDEEIAGQKFEDDVKAEIRQWNLNDARDIWRGQRLEASTTDDIALSGGIDYYVGLNGYNETAAALTETALFDFIDNYFNRQIGKGGKLWMNGAQLKLVSKFDSTILRRDADSKVRGGVAATIVTNEGNEIDIAKDKNIEAGKVYILDSKNISRPYLRPLQAEYLGIVGDYREMQLSKEDTFRVNSSRQMARLTITA